MGLDILSFFWSLVILWFVLTGRIDNGNVWGIYIKDKKIDIGDFWLSLGVVYFFVAAVVDGRDLWVKLWA